MRIGWIGVGVMGSRMVHRLIEAGHALTLYNRSKEGLEPFKNRAILAQSIEQLAIQQDLIITMVGFPKDVEQVYAALLTSVQAPTILVDMTTSSPLLAKRIAQQATLRGIPFLDAPVTGGDIGAKQGTLTIMVGGNERDFIKMKSILDVLGKHIVYMGSSGQGMAAKLANQIAIAGAITGLAESLSFAQEQSLDLNPLLAIIQQGAAQSFQAFVQGPKMVKQDYQAGFYIKHFQKDLALAIETSTSELPMTKMVKSFYDWMVQHGYQDLGTQAIIEYFKHRSSSK